MALIVNVFLLSLPHRYEFLRTPATQLTDGGRDLLMKQLGFQLINPTEKWFPGISELRENFSSWDWRIGKTPKFSVQKSIQLKSEGADQQQQQQQQQEMKVKVDVEKVRWLDACSPILIGMLMGLVALFFFFQGLIQEISLLIPGQEPIPVVSNLVGKPYLEDCFHGILDAMKGASTENLKHAMGLWDTGRADPGSSRDEWKPICHNSKQKRFNRAYWVGRVFLQPFEKYGLRRVSVGHLKCRFEEWKKTRGASNTNNTGRTLFAKPFSLSVGFVFLCHIFLHLNCPPPSIVWVSACSI